MSRYKVVIGEDFEIGAVDIDPQVDVPSALREKKALDEAKTRSRVTFALLFAIAFALAVAALIRLVSGDFNALESVWSAVAVPLGWIGGYYFGAKE